MSFQPYDATTRKHANKQRDRRIRTACQQLRFAQLQTSADLDALLDADPDLRAQPAVRDAVRKHIQELVPHLRDN